MVAHLGTAPGGYAELAVVDAERPHELPEGLSYPVAVAMIGTGRTAMGIIEMAAFRPGDVAVITAAAGGLGGLLVQEARHAGATVVGLAGGPAKTARVRELGADVAVDYTAPDWPAAVRKALDGAAPTVALDGVGGEIGRQVLDLLGIGGRIILYGGAGAGGALTELTTGDLYAKGLTASVAVGPRLMHRPGGMRALEETALAAAASGRLVPAVQTFPLAQAAAAHAALESRATMGKVVLVP